MKLHRCLRVELTKCRLIARHIKCSVRLGELKGKVLYLLASLHLLLLILHLRLLEAVLYKLLTALLHRLKSSEKSTCKSLAGADLPGIVCSKCG
ncbi:hypothetical protein FHW69_001591 [Luteibacter sp. Sphag1AF]|uniref:hypothetical protein n=1 Tax=Luteibacter sp. Sphag1AF TaxID=2587031 RepID=UPI0016151963|nr:hypothetical protein [Luteibacter sp. Sphag1AF]MBB3226990.1 hypothetical protein [Luteibacter sp. Sphag1AF]